MKGNQLIQLLYGEDGMDGAKVEFQSLPTYTASDYAFEDRLVHIQPFPQQLIDRIYSNKSATYWVADELAVSANLNSSCSHPLIYHKSVY